MASRGAAAQNRGKRFERDCANYMTERLGIKIASARSVSGGTQAGKDLVSFDPDLCMHVYGWSLECKAWTSSCVPTWIRQAKKDSDGSGLYAVIQKRDGKPIGAARVWMPWDVYERWTRETARTDGVYASMSLEEFCELLKGRWA